MKGRQDLKMIITFLSSNLIHLNNLILISKLKVFPIANIKTIGFRLANNSLNVFATKKILINNCSTWYINQTYRFVLTVLKNIYIVLYYIPVSKTKSSLLIWKISVYL